MVIEHPFENSIVRPTAISLGSQLILSQAFILTKDTKHYRTNDRGKTWRPFDVPVPPAFVGQPLSFHSDKKNWGYILYQGTKCEREGPWGYTCHDKVRLLHTKIVRSATAVHAPSPKPAFRHSVYRIEPLAAYITVGLCLSILPSRYVIAQRFQPE